MTQEEQEQEPNAAEQAEVQPLLGEEERLRQEAAEYKDKYLCLHN